MDKQQEEVLREVAELEENASLHLNRLEELTRPWPHLNLSYALLKLEAQLALLEQQLNMEVALDALRLASSLNVSASDLRAAALAQDIEDLLGFCLAHDAKQLYAALPERYGSYMLASKAQHAAKQLKTKVRNLYNL